MPISHDKLLIAVDDEKIAGTIIAPESKKSPGVLFIHGWGGSQDDCLAPARLAADRGFACLAFDLRGHGETFDQRIKITREENLRDVIAAYDFLVAQPNVEPAEICLVGISYGGYLAAIATTLRSVSALALRAPAIYKDTNWTLPKLKLHEDPELVLYRRSLVSWDDNRALLACVAFTGDVLLVSSELDDVVPPTVSESYVAAFTQPCTITSRVIAGADHGLSEERWRREYTVWLIDWITEVMRVPEESAANRLAP
jgi:uncharacterized protein